MSRWGVFDVDKGRCGNWERLTEASLVLHIFSLLELEDLFRLRSVCRSWYDAVVSPHFVELYKPPLDPWAVLRVRSGRPAERDEEVYDDRHFDYGMELESHAELWRPVLEGARKVRAFPLGPPASKFLGLCSSNGLACGILMEERSSSSSLTIAVGNPILNKWKTLPPAPVASSHLPRPAYLSIFMEAAADANPAATCAYQIVVLYEDDEERLHSLQYDHGASWQHGPDFTTGSSTGLPLRGYAFYRGMDGMFAAYDPHTRSWSHVIIENPVCDEPQGSPWADWCLTYVGAFRYKGKCYWASLLFDASSLEEFGAAIWEMVEDVQKSSWVLVSRVLCRDLFGANWCLSEGNKDMRVMLLGDTVFISAFYRKETYGVWPPVAYDFVRSKWYSASCASGIDKTVLDYDIECSYVVLPSLTAKP